MEGSQVAAGTGTNSLGKYRLIAELGHGGMAEVFLAVVRGPAGFNKLVVIKQIRPQLAEDPEFLGMFLDEARLAARLSHANVVQTNEVGEEGSRYFIAMEYLEGQPLNRVLHRLGRTATPPSATTATGSPGIQLVMHLRIISEVLSGLHHAHELTDYDGTPLGVVHRDVTPHNVFITYEGGVKVVDFGIAKALNSSSETRTGVLKGKVAYMAPEQAQGERVDRRADIFSVGVMLWEAATGKRLWKGVPDITILQRLLSGEIPSPSKVKPEVPERLEALIMKALAHRREDRYANALDLQTDLDAFVDSTGERISGRDIGKAITAAFEADRAKIKAIIDEQLRSKTGVFSVPALLLSETSQNLTLIDPHTQSAANGSASERYGIESGGTPRSDPLRPSPSYTAASMLSLTSAAPPVEDGRPKRRSLVAVAAVGFGILFGLGVWGITRNLGPAPAATGNAVPTTTAATVTSAPAPEVEIKISVTPAEATIFLDDKPVSNPYKTRLPSDKAKHHLRIEAAGFIPVTKPVSLENGVDIELSLQKDMNTADKGDKGSSPTKQIVPVQPPDDGMKHPGVRPKRTLDPTSPYPQQ